MLLQHGRRDCVPYMFKYGCEIAQPPHQLFRIILRVRNRN